MVLAAKAKTILLTGCTGGIGLEAAKILHGEGHRLLLIARTREKALAAIQEIKASNEGRSNDEELSRVEAFGADLSSMESVKQVAGEVESVLKKNNKNGFGSGIDVICLNAGMVAQRNSSAEITIDGFERTFATNYLSPFLLVHELFHLVNDNGRFITTSSGTHFKASFGSFAGIDTETLKCSSMIDGSNYDYFRAYSLSKLCNTAFSIELNRRLQKHKKNMLSVAFSPGFIPSTGLFQSQNRIGIKLLDWGAYLFGYGDSVEWGGGAMAWLATIDRVIGGVYYRGKAGVSSRGGTYTKDFKQSMISAEASDNENQERLWEISCKILNIDVNRI